MDSGNDIVIDTGTISDLLKFMSRRVCCLQVNNRVYDCTEFLRLHPGGADSILINAGTDSSEEFDAIHSLKAWKMLDKYYIGQLRPG